MVRPLERRPERLQAVRVGLLPDVLADAVPDRLMVRQVDVDAGFVGVHIGVQLRVAVDEYAWRRAVHMGDRQGVDFVGRTVPSLHDGSLADRPASQVQTLAGVPVPFQAAATHRLRPDLKACGCRRPGPRGCGAPQTTLTSA